MSANDKNLRRYTLLLPETLFAEMQQVADAQQISLIELFRKFIRLGLLAYKLEESGDGALLIQKGDTQQRVMLI